MSEHRDSTIWLHEVNIYKQSAKTQEVVERMRKLRDAAQHSCALACITVNEMKGEIL